MKTEISMKCSIRGEKSNAFKILVGKLQGKGPG
jgi:hypothetical protein